MTMMTHYLSIAPLERRCLLGGCEDRYNAAVEKFSVWVQSVWPGVNVTEFEQMASDALCPGAGTARGEAQAPWIIRESAAQEHTTHLERQVAACKTQLDSYRQDGVATLEEQLNACVQLRSELNETLPGVQDQLNTCLESSKNTTAYDPQKGKIRTELHRCWAQHNRHYATISQLEGWLSTAETVKSGKCTGSCIGTDRGVLTAKLKCTK